MIDAQIAIESMESTATYFRLLTPGPDWAGEPVEARAIDPVADEGALLAIYSSTRQEELRQVPWTDEQKAVFLKGQYEAQHKHYFAHYGQAEYLALEQAGAMIGRYYLDRSKLDLHVLDIALLPQHRGCGIGTAILGQLVEEAKASGRGIVLYVEHQNPARRLYARLGFKFVEDAGMYAQLAWRGRES